MVLGYAKYCRRSQYAAILLEHGQETLLNSSKMLTANAITKESVSICFLRPQMRLFTTRTFSSPLIWKLK